MRKRGTHTEGDVPVFMAPGQGVNRDIRGHKAGDENCTESQALVTGR